MADSITINLNLKGQDAVQKLSDLFKDVDFKVTAAKRSLDSYYTKLDGSRTKVKLLKEEFMGFRKVQVTALDKAGQSIVSLEKQASKAQSVFETLNRERNRLIGAFAAAGIGRTIFSLYLNQVVKLKDELALARMQIEKATKDENAFDRVRDSAFELGVQVKDLAQIVTRFGVAVEGDIPSDKLLEWAEKLVIAGKSFGLSTIEVISAVRQTSQAMSSASVKGDELRSILENLPPLAQSLAREMKANVGELRDLGAEGKITGEILAAALDNLENNIDAMPETFERATNRLSTAWTKLIDNMTDEGSFITDLVNEWAQALNNIAKFISDEDTLLPNSKEIKDRIQQINELDEKLKRNREIDLPAGSGAFTEFLKIYNTERKRLRDEIDMLRKDVSSVGGKDDILMGGGGSEELLGGTTGFAEDTLSNTEETINKTSGAMQDYYNQLKEQAYDIESVYVNTFKGVEDSIVSLVTTGKANFKDLARSVIADITRMIAKQLILKALTASIPGFGGFLGLSAGAPVASYASGSRFVPRDGLAYLHRGERVVPASQNTVTNNTTERPVNIINVTDPGQIADVMSSSAGEQVMMNFINRNPDAIRQVLV